MVPIMSEPPSPRYIFDFCPTTLKIKNGMSAPAAIMAIAERSISPALKKNEARIIDTTIE